MSYVYLQCRNPRCPTLLLDLKYGRDMLETGMPMCLRCGHFTLVPSKMYDADDAVSSDESSFVISATAITDRIDSVESVSVKRDTNLEDKLRILSQRVSAVEKSNAKIHTVEPFCAEMKARVEKLENDVATLKEYSHDHSRGPNTGCVPVFTSSQSAALALDVLKESMQQDRGYANAWHDNIAIACQDVGVDYDVSQKAASTFMLRTFGIMTISPKHRP